MAISGSDLVNAWVFLQLGGEQKSLHLSGWAAPFGRPRHGVVVADGIEVRHATTRYPGNPVPTRHLFGTKLDDFELSGRFMDSAGGKGFAQAKAEEVKQFVADQQEVLIRWSDIIQVTGFIEKFSPKREGPGDVAWSMTILIDQDEKADRGAFSPLQQNPSYSIQRIAPLVGPISTEISERNRLRGDIADLFDTLVSNVTTAFSYLADVSEQIDTLVKAPLGTINRFRAAVRQFKTVALQMRATMERMLPEDALSTRRATEEQVWADTRARFSANLALILAELADIDRQSRLAQQGRIRAIITAKQGDTWESLAQRVYGSADRAGDLRDANGAAPGEHPEQGTDYIAPQ
jgi:hypothetical protein